MSIPEGVKKIDLPGRNGSFIGSIGFAPIIGLIIFEIKVNKVRAGLFLGELKGLLGPSLTDPTTVLEIYISGISVH